MLMTREYERESLSNERLHSTLSAQLGHVGMELIHTAAHDDIQERLGPTGKRSDQRRKDLNLELAALGDQVMTSVDLVIGIEGAIQNYREATTRLVNDSVLYRAVPGYLEAILGNNDSDEHAAAQTAWDTLVQIKHGKQAATGHRIETGRGFKRNAVEKQTQPRSGMPAKNNRATRAKKRFDASASASLRASQNAKRLDSEM